MNVIRRLAKFGLSVLFGVSAIGCRTVPPFGLATDSVGTASAFRETRCQSIHVALKI